MPEGKVYSATVDGREFLVDVDRSEGSCRVSVNGAEVAQVDMSANGCARQFSLLLDHQSYEGLAEMEGGELRIWVEGEPFEVQVVDQRLKALSGGRVGGAAAVQAQFKTPMPGIVVEVRVQPGQTVAKGDPILTLESMKMRNDLKSPRDGTVGQVLVSAGQTVAKGDVLVEYAL